MRRFLLLGIALVAASLAGCAEQGDDLGPVGGEEMGDDLSEDDTAGYAGNNATDPPASNVTGFDLEPVIEGERRPLFLAEAPDGSGRIFVVGKFGTIHVYKGGERLDEPFLDVSDRIAAGGEQGLLGMAFDPDFGENGRVFVSYTAGNGDSVLASYRVDAANPDRLDPGSAQEILRVPQPESNHNAGTILFGPDGYLYMSLGDGGGGGDPHDNGQDPHTLLGTILRLDVRSQQGGYTVPPDNPFVSGGGAPEVWAYGLRNPWRFSFDRETGDLWIGDVGQNEIEEVNFQPASSTGGENYGWAIYEGSERFKGGEPHSDVVFPVAEYAHEDGHCSVTGGYVYRGTEVPPLQGIYVFADFCSGTVYGVRQVEGEWVRERLLQTDLRIAGFAEDAEGELYAVDEDGVITRFVPGENKVPEALTG